MADGEQLRERCPEWHAPILPATAASAACIIGLIECSAARRPTYCCCPQPRVTAILPDMSSTRAPLLRCARRQQPECSTITPFRAILMSVVIYVGGTYPVTAVRPGGRRGCGVR